MSPTARGTKIKKTPDKSFGMRNQASTSSGGKVAECEFRRLPLRADRKIQIIPTDNVCPGITGEVALPMPSNVSFPCLFSV